MRAIGYAQFYDAYLGRCTEEQAIEAIKLATRRFAKRQFTWFKRDAATVWLDASEMNTEQIATKITELL